MSRRDRCQRAMQRVHDLTPGGTPVPVERLTEQCVTDTWSDAVLDCIATAATDTVAEACIQRELGTGGSDTTL